MSHKHFTIENVSLSETSHIVMFRLTTKKENFLLYDYLDAYSDKIELDQRKKPECYTNYENNNQRIVCVDQIRAALSDYLTIFN